MSIAIGRCVLSLLLAVVSFLAVVEGGETGHVLFRTIRRGDTQLLQSLLRQGAPVNLRLADGTTPLMLAALHGTADCVSVLLEYGADPNAANQKGVTALLWAAGAV